ncbi:hypothetical protein [Bradyrhizobium prioriisuperbiae]|uniref:hypothetical protein n=1 Tax=Bradyrhizobium prioriisuperbiae TaxID=2854389 RepID=UPI0028E95019|nr:hypothetical protein [Bradyrhizobium prioritasuperba]
MTTKLVGLRFSLPEVSLPWIAIKGCPVGLSAIARLSVIIEALERRGVPQAALALNQVIRRRDS